MSVVEVHEDEVLDGLDDNAWRWVDYTRLRVPLLAAAFDRLPKWERGLSDSEVIAKAMNVSKSTAPRYRRALHALGFIKNVWGFYLPDQDRGRLARVTVVRDGGAEALLERVEGHDLWVLVSRVRPSSEQTVEWALRGGQEPVGVWWKKTKDWRDRVAVVAQSQLEREKGPSPREPSSISTETVSTEAVPTVVMVPTEPKGWREFVDNYLTPARADLRRSQDGCADQPLAGLRPAGCLSLRSSTPTPFPLAHDDLVRVLFGHEALGKPKSTAYRHLSEWEARGLVTKVPGMDNRWVAS